MSADLAHVLAFIPMPLLALTTAAQAWFYWRHQRSRVMAALNAAGVICFLLGTWAAGVRAGFW